MALIKCPECGKEFSDQASSCPNCGCPTNYFTKNSDVYSKKNFVSYTRLSLSILMIALSLFIIYQSFIAGVVNLANSYQNLEGSMGVILALFQIAYGIIGIVTHKSEKLKFIKILGVIIAFTGLNYAIVPKDVFEALTVWSWLLFCTGVIFFINACYLKHKLVKKYPAICQDQKTVQRENIETSSLTRGESIAYHIILILGAICIFIIIVLVIYRTFINPF